MRLQTTLVFLAYSLNCSSVSAQGLNQGDFEFGLLASKNVADERFDTDFGVAAFTAAGITNRLHAYVEAGRIAGVDLDTFGSEIRETVFDIDTTMTNVGGGIHFEVVEASFTPYVNLRSSAVFVEEEGTQTLIQRGMPNEPQPSANPEWERPSTSVSGCAGQATHLATGESESTSRGENRTLNCAKTGKALADLRLDFSDGLRKFRIGPAKSIQTQQKLVAEVTIDLDRERSLCCANIPSAFKTLRLSENTARLDSPFITLGFLCGWGRGRTTEGGPGCRGTVDNFVAVESSQEPQVSTRSP